MLSATDYDVTGTCSTRGLTCDRSYPSLPSTLGDVAGGQASRLGRAKRRGHRLSLRGGRTEAYPYADSDPQWLQHPRNRVIESLGEVVRCSFNANSVHVGGQTCGDWFFLCWFLGHSGVHAHGLGVNISVNNFQLAEHATWRKGPCRPNFGYGCGFGSESDLAVSLWFRLRP